MLGGWVPSTRTFIRVAFTMGPTEVTNVLNATGLKTHNHAKQPVRICDEEKATFQN